MLEEHNPPLDTFELAAGVYQVGQASKSLSDIGNGCGRANCRMAEAEPGLNSSGG
jgi:hypothetical protein